MLPAASLKIHAYRRQTLNVFILFIVLLILLTSCQAVTVPRPTNTPTFTLTPNTPTATVQSMNVYHDPLLGISVNYPNKWKEVGFRRFKGDDGYLKISELPDYHSLSADHVCSDYASTNLTGEVYSFMPFGDIPGCIIFQTSVDKLKPGDKVLSISRRYNPVTYEYDYFLLETRIPDLKQTTFYPVIDKHSLLVDSLSLPSPQPLDLSLNGLHISETFIKAANFDGENWNLKGLYVSDKNRDYSTNTHCGESIIVDGHTLVVDRSDNNNVGVDIIKIKQDEKVVFSINIFSSPSSGELVFCEWNGSWFLETSDFVIQDGQILNHKLGYDEMFGWQILAGKPFYFFTKGGIVFLSYNGQVLPVEYNFVPHYGCCEEGSVRNPGGNDNQVWFFGTRDGAWYLVNINVN